MSFDDFKHFVKPSPQAFEKLYSVIRKKFIGEEVIFIDDQISNILIAKTFNMKTIYVTNNAESVGSNYNIKSIFEIKKLLV